MFQPQQVTITPIQHYVIIFNKFSPTTTSLSDATAHSGLGRLTVEVSKLHAI
jgi:hypothetical protein